MRIVGFTGSQNGGTPQQLAWLRGRLITADVLHHGACIGADEQAHLLALELGMGNKMRGVIVVHPPEQHQQDDAADVGRQLRRQHRGDEA